MARVEPDVLTKLVLLGARWAPDLRIRSARIADNEALMTLL